MICFLSKREKCLKNITEWHCMIEDEQLGGVKAWVKITLTFKFGESESF